MRGARGGDERGTRGKTRGRQEEERKDTVHQFVLIRCDGCDEGMLVVVGRGRSCFPSFAYLIYSYCNITPEKQS